MAGKDWKASYKGKTGGMLIDPLFDGNPKDLYPVLNEIPCTISELHYDLFIKVCAFVLDPNSPIVREYSDLNARREYVNDLLGYRGHQDRKFEVLMLQKVYRNTEWRLLCTVDSVFDEFEVRANEELVKQTDEEKMLKAVSLKKKYIDDMKDMIEICEDAFASSGRCFNLTHIQSKSRDSQLVIDRRIACGALRLCGYSLQNIGKFIKRSHANVMYLLNCHPQQESVEFTKQYIIKRKIKRHQLIIQELEKQLK